MERFGGYGRHSELGVTLYQLIEVLEFAQVENWEAVQDSLAPLAIIDQAALDGGPFE